MLPSTIQKRLKSITNQQDLMRLAHEIARIQKVETRQVEEDEYEEEVEEIEEEEVVEERPVPRDAEPHQARLG